MLRRFVLRNAGIASGTMPEPHLNSDHPGSSWRRWDPHVHLPGTLHNDNFGNLTVAEALDTLAERSPQIEVAGITDYCTTASFRRARDAHAAGAGDGIALLFPNVELRLSHATRRESAVNIHLLCEPEEVDELDRFLAGLEFGYDDCPYRGDEDGLRRLGRAYEAERLDDTAALRAGARQFKIDFDQLRRKYKNDGWAKRQLLVAVAGGGTDGTSGLQTSDGAFAALRRNIERFAHMVFSGDPKQTEFWLGRGADDVPTLTTKYGGKKPCIHGSDAHELDRLGRPDLDRFCWLKGDPTFQTLRMACLSPETRVHIGERDPMDGYRQGRIATVAVPGTPWFPGEGVAVNPGLVAIIGPRGSGKTALADLIAAGSGSQDPFTNRRSFIRRAGRLVQDCVSQVTWTHTEVTKRALSGTTAPDPTQPRGVRYLSQQFVEQLCAADGVSDNLLEELERVVFASVPPGRRQGATNFQELLSIRLHAAKGRQEEHLDAIAELGERITRERLLMRALPALKEQVKKDEGTLRRLETQTRELTSTGDPGSAERLANLTAVLERRVAALQDIERRITDLRGLHSRVRSTQTSAFPRIAERLREEYTRAALTDEEWAAFTPQFSGPVEEVIASALATAENEQRAVAGDDPSTPMPKTLDGVEAGRLQHQPVSILSAEQKRLEKAVGLDRQRASNLEKLNGRASELRSRLEKSRAEVVDAEGAAGRGTMMTNERLRHYALYFDALLEEETELRDLYRPLESTLVGFTTSAEKLRLTVRRKVDLDTWTAVGEALLDLRVGGRFKGTGELRQVAADELLGAWETGDGSQAAQAIRAFSQNHSASLRDQSKARASDAEAYRDWERRVNRWLYSAEHISLSYTLMYDNLSIERLSPGSRGIVLLLLYLAIDRAESDPLIIDQPEENLDPESVYSELVDLFREASRRRQIIMVTHNANLVVNTDVDQVIVAHSENFEEGRLPTFSYRTGGLEDAEVRREVCEVLEGGAEAFRQRARRLGLSIEV